MMIRPERYAAKLSTMFRYSIIEGAQKTQLLNYTQLTNLLGVPRGGNTAGKRMLSIGHLLGDLGEFCDKIKKPPLNSLVVNKVTKVPSNPYPQNIGKKQGYNTIQKTQAACYTAYKEFSFTGIDAQIEEFVVNLK